MPNHNIKTILKLKRGIKEDLDAIILEEGEPGYDLENNVFKIGNGQDSWDALPEIKSNSAPKGWFENESDLENKEIGYYINLNEESPYQGYLYYWDGTNISSALYPYQALQLANNSVSKNKLTNDLYGDLKGNKSYAFDEYGNIIMEIIANTIDESTFVNFEDKDKIVSLYISAYAASHISSLIKSVLPNLTTLYIDSTQEEAPISFVISQVFYKYEFDIKTLLINEALKSLQINSDKVIGFSSSGKIVFVEDEIKPATYENVDLIRSLYIPSNITTIPFAAPYLTAYAQGYLDLYINNNEADVQLEGKTQEDDEYITCHYKNEFELLDLLMQAHKALDADLANKVNKPNKSVGFDTNGIIISMTNDDYITAASFTGEEKSIYLDPGVLQVGANFFSNMPNLTDIYIDNLIDRVTFIDTKPSSVTIHDKYQTHLSNLLINSSLQLNNKIDQLSALVGSVNTMLENAINGVSEE